MNQPVLAPDELRALGLRPIMGGDGEETPNPYAAFGLGPDGNPLPKKNADGTDAPGDLSAANKALITKISGLETELKGLKDAAGEGQKTKALLDRLSRAITGEEAPSPTATADKKLWAEFRDVVKGTSPAFAKLLSAIEKDPDLLDNMQRAQVQSQTLTLAQTNSAAHDAVANAAKSFFKGATETEIAEIVLPFEKSISDMINANPQLRARFLSGEAHVVAKELFERLIKPHASMRLRSKQNAGKSDLPKAPPKGGAGSGASSPDGDGKKTPLIKSVDDKGKRNFDLRTPQGRAAFHKAAINRSLDRRSGDDD